mgnify:FL=1
MILRSVKACYLEGGQVVLYLFLGWFFAVLVCLCIFWYFEELDIGWGEGEGAKSCCQSHLGWL